MKDAFLIIAGLLVLLALGVATSGGGGLFSGNGSSTPFGFGNASSSPLTDDVTLSNPPTSSWSEPERTRTPEETEYELARIYRELDSLTEALREQKLREPESPFRGKVFLSIGNARETDHRREYVTIEASTGNREPIEITGWYLESYVTEKREAIPEGDRIMQHWRNPNSEPIVLFPGEFAYILSGESPIDTSFRENLCTGYIEEDKNFYPSLRLACPSPLDELRRFGTSVELDDDRCYDLLERTYLCTTPETDDRRGARISARCESFIDNTLSYSDCVTKHRHDPFFDDVGDWRIYLDRTRELWREEREIIRLMDSEGRVVDVVSY